MAKILNFAGPNLCQSSGSQHLLDLKKAGAQMLSGKCRGLGVMSDDVNFSVSSFRDSMELQAQEGDEQNDDREFNSLKPMQSWWRTVEDVNFLQLQLELL
ncbi:unnamed protein product [Prunus armeniaca]|uniref:Uncharacterized protein n=1 Tax=Prunus armeniaca TaxID=36596 RepID=A0A6J5Y793_PRUAR|nr:unnamed protein product [Prunus armeniaca]